MKTLTEWFIVVTLVCILGAIAHCDLNHQQKYGTFSFPNHRYGEETTGSTNNMYHRECKCTKGRSGWIDGKVKCFECGKPWKRVK